MIHSFINQFSPADRIAILASASVVAQYLVRSFPLIRKLEDEALTKLNVVASFVLPYAAVAAAQGSTLSMWPKVYLGAQVVYNVVKFIQGQAKKEAVTPELSQQF